MFQRMFQNNYCSGTILAGGKIYKIGKEKLKIYHFVTKFGVYESPRNVLTR